MSCRASRECAENGPACLESRREEFSTSAEGCNYSFEPPWGRAPQDTCPCARVLQLRTGTSLGLDAGLAQDRRPFLGLALDEGAGLLGRHRNDAPAVGLQPAADFDVAYGLQCRHPQPPDHAAP